MPHPSTGPLPDLPDHLFWLQDRVQSLVRPGAFLRRELGALSTMGSTRAWGPPDLPADAAWCQDVHHASDWLQSPSQGEAFYLQLDLAEIPAAVRRAAWPVEGVVWVFIDILEHSGQAGKDGPSSMRVRELRFRGVDARNSIISTPPSGRSGPRCRSSPGGRFPKWRRRVTTSVTWRHGFRHTRRGVRATSRSEAGSARSRAASTRPTPVFRDCRSTPPIPTTAAWCAPSNVRNSAIRERSTCRTTGGGGSASASTPAESERGSRATGGAFKAPRSHHRGSIEK